MPDRLEKVLIVCYNDYCQWLSIDSWDGLPPAPRHRLATNPTGPEFRDYHYLCNTIPQ